jgi:GWxTD domain-containing protein
VYLIVAGGEIEGEREESRLHETSRPLTVVSAGFPRPSSMKVLLAASTYVMNETEKDSVKTLKTSRERTRMFEDFWLSIAGTKEAAQALIRQYFSRVEEANLHFSSFQEGWRTDRGMVYIVLGPPVSVQTTAQGELWNYSQNEGDRPGAFLFQRVSYPDELSPFEHYVLERQPFYDQIWSLAVDRWRRGVGL